MNFNLDDLTIEEVEIIEDILDTSFEQAFAPGAKRGKAMRALAYITLRRGDPTMTIDQVGDIRISTLTAPDKPDPTGPADA